MKEFKNINEILDFAINAEQQAVNFYTNLASISNNEQMKKVFLEFAQEEMKHKSKLSELKANKTYRLPEEKIKDLKIAEYLGKDITPSPDLKYPEALVLAMKKEKNAFRLYLLLSEEAPTLEMKQLFLTLAQEESKHKLRFEMEYDEYILREN